MFTNFSMDESLSKFAIIPEKIFKVQKYLLELAKYTRVIWLGARIEPHVDEGFMLTAGCDFKYQLRPNQLAAFQLLDEAIESEIGGKNPRLEYVSQIKLTHFDMSTDFTTCDHLLWSDGDHWSGMGEKLFGERLNQKFKF